MALLKWIGGPGSIGFLAVCCTIGLAFRFAGLARLGRAWLLILYVVYIVIGLPIVANRVASSLSHYRPVQDRRTLQSADAIVVLHGDNVRGRVRETKDVFDATRVQLVIVSGLDDFKDLVVASGIPQQVIVQETSPSTTAEQIAAIATLLRHRGIQRPVLIASRLQMPRVAALLRHAQVDALLAPSSIDDEPPVTGIWRFVPMYIGLRVTRDALYEHAAVSYYRRKGLIDAASRAAESVSGLARKVSAPGDEQSMHAG